MFVLITIINWIAVAIFLPGAISWSTPIVESGKTPEYTAIAVLALCLLVLGFSVSATGMSFYLIEGKHTIGNALMASSISLLFIPRIVILPNLDAQLHCLISTVGYVLVNAVLWSFVYMIKKRKTIEPTGQD